MKKALVFLAAAAMVCSLASCGGGRAMKTDIDSISYSLGTDFGSSLKQLLGQFQDEPNMDLFYQGVEDALNEETVIPREEAYALLRQYFNVTVPRKALEKSQAYLAEIEAQPNVKKTETGLLYEVVNEGNPHKKPMLNTDKVKVMYEGKLRTGEVFDSSYERGDTATFALNQVIKGWSEGMKLIGEGGEIKLWIPAELAYGQRAPQTIGPNQALAFTVELVEVIPTPEEEIKKMEEAKKATPKKRK